MAARPAAPATAAAAPSGRPQPSAGRPEPSDSGPAMSGAGGDPAERRRFGVQPDSHQIFVGNLPQDISEPELTEHFSPFGEALKGLSLVINALLLYEM